MSRLRHNDAADPADDPCSRRRCGHRRGGHQIGADGRVTCAARRHEPFGGSAPCRCTGFVEKRKPPAAAATTVSMNLRWLGDLPATGDYLMSPKRPRNGYRVVSFTPCRRFGLADTSCFDVMAERVPAKDVPAGAKVHAFRWDPRSPKSKTR